MKQSDAQILGRKAQRWFEAHLPAEWVFQRPTEDFGIDGVVVIVESGELNGIEFRVQIKGSHRWERQDSHLLLPNVKRRTVRDWAAGLSPTVLALYEEATDAGFLCWVLDLFDSPAQCKRLFTEDSATLTLKVPTDLAVDDTCWDRVRERLRKSYEATVSGLQAARVGATLMPLLRTLSECVRNLHCVNTYWRQFAQSGEKAGLLLLLETKTHEEVVRALRRFRAVLPTDILLSRQIDSAVEFYTSKVTEFYDGFDCLVDNPNESTAVRANPAVLVKQRPYMIGVVVDFLVRLSGLSDSSDREQNRAYDATMNPFPFPWATILKNMDKSNADVIDE